MRFRSSSVVWGNLDAKNWEEKNIMKSINKMVFWGVGTVIASLFVPNMSLADTLTLDKTKITETQVRKSPNPNEITYYDQTYSIGSWSGTYATQRTLLKVDLASIPVGMQIQSATLYLYDAGDPWSSTATTALGSANFYRMLVGWNATEATFNNRTASDLWAGTQGPTNDGVIAVANASLSVDVPLGPDAANKFRAFDLTNDVQNLYSNPSANYGWLIAGREEWDDQVTGKGYAWAHYSAQSSAWCTPYLEVTYAPAPVVPEPSSMLSFASGLIGIVGFAIRKRIS